MNRITSSVIYALIFKKKQSINATAVWGINVTHESKENALLEEATYQIDKFAVYGRYEWVQKDERELNLGAAGSVIHNVHALTAGVAYNFVTFYHIALVAGAQSTLNFMDQSLRGQYGNVPVSAEVYLMIRSSSMAGLMHKKSTSSMKGMDM